LLLTIFHCTFVLANPAAKIAIAQNWGGLSWGEREAAGIICGVPCGCCRGPIHGRALRWRSRDRSTLGIRVRRVAARSNGAG